MISAIVLAPVVVDQRAHPELLILHDCGECDLTSELIFALLKHERVIADYMLMHCCAPFSRKLVSSRIHVQESCSAVH